MYACFDIGGSAIKIAAIGEDLTFEGYQVIDTKDDLDYIIGVIKKVVKEYQEKYSIKGICLSMPGSVDIETGIIHGFSALQCIHGFSWKERLAKEIDLPVSIENDANCVALCEVEFGKAKDKQDIISLVLGSGVGGSIIKNKRIHHGATLFGGEFGYMIFNREKPYTIFSGLASTNALVKNARKRLNDDSINGEDVFAKANEGNEICMECIDEFYHHLAIGIYNLKFAYDPEMIVFSGAVSQQADFIEQVYQHVESLMKDVFSVEFGHSDIQSYIPLMEVSAFSRNANLYGALASFIKEYNI